MTSINLTSSSFESKSSRLNEFSERLELLCEHKAKKENLKQKETILSDATRETTIYYKFIQMNTKNFS